MNTEHLKNTTIFQLLLPPETGQASRRLRPKYHAKSSTNSRCPWQVESDWWRSALRTWAHPCPFRCTSARRSADSMRNYYERLSISTCQRRPARCQRDLDTIIIHKLYKFLLILNLFTNLNIPKRLNRPLSVLPRMIVLGVHVQDFLGQTQLTRGIVQPFNDHSPMMPHLIVLRVIDDYILGVAQLGQQVHVQGLDDVPAILPDGIVGRVQFQCVLG